MVSAAGDVGRVGEIEWGEVVVAAEAVQLEVGRATTTLD